MCYKRLLHHVIQVEHRVLIRPVLHRGRLSPCIIPRSELTAAQNMGERIRSAGRILTADAASNPLLKAFAPLIIRLVANFNKFPVASSKVVILFILGPKLFAFPVVNNDYFLSCFNFVLIFSR